jgi:hypothetical protein
MDMLLMVGHRQAVQRKGQHCTYNTIGCGCTLQWTAPYLNTKGSIGTADTHVTCSNEVHTTTHAAACIKWKRRRRRRRRG